MGCNLLSIPGNVFKCTTATLSKVWLEHRNLVIGAVIVASTCHIYKTVRNSNRRKRWDSIGKDVVLLHSTAESTSVPNASPFVMKLETYMRMANIKYEIEQEVPMGPKGKFPWITINGKDLADSSLIIEFLADKFSINFTSHLDAKQLAVSRALLIMIEEHGLWGLVLWRFILGLRFFLDNSRIPLNMRYLPLDRIFRNKLRVIGVGRHTDDEFTEMIRKDLEALSIILGENDYFMGSQPCELDCSAFGWLSQLYWTLQPGTPLERFVKHEFRNLGEFCKRMKQEFWPDWDERLLK